MILIAIYVCMLNCYEILIAAFSMLLIIIFIGNRLQFMSKEEQSAMSVSLNQLQRHIQSVLSQVPHQRYVLVFLYALNDFFIIEHMRQ